MNPGKPLTPSSTRQLLELLQHRPRQPLGQNFLVDANIVRKSIQLAELKAGEAVVEIGPGLGTLTSALLDAGARVHAVELDPVLAEHIRQTFGERLSLLEGDAVDHPIGTLPTEQPVQSTQFKVVANLPYAITSPWLEGILAGPLPERLVLMMQKEAVDRLLAQPGSKNIGAVSIFLQAAYQPDGRHWVSRQCFFPIPGVDSVLLVLQRKGQPMLFPPTQRNAIRKIFTQRRKQLQALCRESESLMDWFSECKKRGWVHDTIRAEAVPLQAWNLLSVSYF